MNLEARVYDTIHRQHMITPGDHIVIGVSGGADSICLLHVLKELKERLQVELRAVHVHHGLRERAEQDADYTQSCCRQWGIPLRVVYADVRREAEQRGRSIEETGRDIRYAWMEQERTDWEREETLQKEGEEGAPGGSFRIAVAHHKEDCAETVLLNLCRGSSLAGLTGIRGMREEIIRPLIDCSREEIEDYLRKYGIGWCTDETNQDYAITRNYLRGKIIPGLQDHVNSRAVEHLCRTAEDLQEAEDFLRQQTKEALSACCLIQGGSGIQSTHAIYSRKGIQGLHPYLKRRVLYAALLQAAGGARDLTYSHVEELERFLCSSGSGTLDLPGGLQAEKVYDRFEIGKRTGANAQKDLRDDRRRLPISEKDYEVRVFSFSGDISQIPRGSYTKWLDYDKIGQFPTFRRRQPSDRMAIRGGAHKKLARIMVDLKIPVSLREQVILPAADKEILWMPGGPIHADYMVTEETKNILELKLHIDKAEDENGR
jgi:tRNA(Ile)-lysidine synthase